MTLRHQQGSAIIEMAVMLPVLILMFIGMVEFGMVISTKREMGIIANQVAGVLYGVRVSDVEDDRLISAVVEEAKHLGSKGTRAEQITVRFCEWRNGSEIYRNYIKTESFSDGKMGGSGGGGCNTAQFKCGAGPATDKGHGAFVQVTTCLTFKPLLTKKIFTTFNVQMPIYNTSYIPMSETNQTQMLAGIHEGGGHNPDDGPTPPCTTPGGCEPEPPVDECKITSCPAGKELVGTGAACACQVKNNCVGSTLDEANNVCKSPGTGCQSPSTMSGDICYYAPACRIVVTQNCWNGQPCANNVCDPCISGFEVVATSGACAGPPNCPAGYTWMWGSVRACAKPNAP